MTRLALCPPKPSVFDTAALTSVFLPSFGTTSRLHSSSGTLYFMVAGTKKADAGDGKNSGICPLIELQEKYDNISDSVSKVIARRRDTDHGDMLPYADGYMTAWFMYHLKGDEEAGVVFFGDNAEILNNANWQDVQKNR